MDKENVGQEVPCGLRIPGFHCCDSSLVPGQGTETSKAMQCPNIHSAQVLRSLDNKQVVRTFPFTVLMNSAFPLWLLYQSLLCHPQWYFREPRVPLLSWWYQVSREYISLVCWIE